MYLSCQSRRVYAAGLGGRVATRAPLVDVLVLFEAPRAPNAPVHARRVSDAPRTAPQASLRSPSGSTSSRPALARSSRRTTRTGSTSVLLPSRATSTSVRPSLAAGRRLVPPLRLLTSPVPHLYRQARWCWCPRQAPRWFRQPRPAPVARASSLSLLPYPSLRARLTRRRPCPPSARRRLALGRAQGPPGP